MFFFLQIMPRTSTGLYSTPPKAKKISSIVAPERLRNAVKEKEAKIEQLLKERDMERKEIAKAANQTEDAERSLDLLRESYMAYKAQSTQQVINCQYKVIQCFHIITLKKIPPFTILSYGIFKI